MAFSLSASIITLNEEANIGRCLNSLAGIADEIVVVDSGSSDQTQQIATAAGARVIVNAFEGHIQQKNFALAQCQHDYVLSLDADEALSEELRQSILSAKHQAAATAYTLNRLTNYCGHWVRHCGWYPDKKLRLVDRRKAKWGGENPHDRLIVNQGEAMRHLSGDLLHYSFPTISSHLRTIESFSEISSKEAYKKGKKANLLVHILLNPAFTFIKKYLFQAGFLDGYYGYVICRLSAVANFAKYTKLRQLHKKAKRR